MRASTPLASASLPVVGTALLGWEVHRRAGVRVVADDVARPGGSAVVGLGLG
ncbi:MAG: DUF1990 domain-containing protein, partial [Actinotalea sp.]|nr:DUF1990 domain-containing protein [Actinotalea sp.]